MWDLGNQLNCQLTEVLPLLKRQVAAFDVTQPAAQGGLLPEDFSKAAPCLHTTELHTKSKSQGR